MSVLGAWVVGCLGASDDQRTTLTSHRRYSLSHQANLTLGSGYRSKSDQTAADAAPDRIGTIRRAELARDRGDVKLDGLVADPKPVRDGFVGQAFGEQLEHLDFA